MISRKSVFLLLVTAAGVSAILLCYAGVKRYRVMPARPLDDLSYRSQDKLQQRKTPKPHGKITIPAEISIDLASPSNPGGPVTIIVSASSQIPVGSGILTLKVPPVGEIPAGAELLWSGAPSDFVAETVEYTVDALPVGKYRFIAIFEFTPNRENAKRLVLSKSLYLDVRPTTIFSSNVSFNHIKRVELWRELEERVAASLRPGSTTTGPKTMANKIADIEALAPGIIASKIAELRLTDPDVARRIMELNRIESDTTGESENQGYIESVKSSFDDEIKKAKSRTFHGQPASEREVPVPEELKN